MQSTYICLLIKGLCDKEAMDEEIKDQKDAKDFRRNFQQIIAYRIRNKI